MCVITGLSRTTWPRISPEQCVRLSTLSLSLSLSRSIFSTKQILVKRRTPRQRCCPFSLPFQRVASTHTHTHTHKHTDIATSRRWSI